MLRGVALVFLSFSTLSPWAQAVISPPVGEAAARQPTVAGAAPLVTVNRVSQSMVGTRVTVQGEVISHTPPRNDRSPHSMLLRDATGTMRIAIWRDLWEKLPLRDKIVPGQKVTVRAEIVEFRGNLEGHPYLPGDVTLGIGAPETAGAALGTVAGTSPAAVPVAAASGVQWRPDLATAMREAAQANRNILIFFENPDVEVSRHVDANVFGDARVCSAVNAKCVPLRVNMVRQDDLARRLGAVRAGIAILYKPDGTAIKKLDNLAPPDDLIRQLP
jgi:hypothetical protein